jgi:hypothetical protein
MRRAGPSELRLARLHALHGGIPTWDVIGHPFRLVALGGGWLVVPAGGDARRLLARHGLLARPLRTRTAAVQALTTVLETTRLA